MERGRPVVCRDTSHEQGHETQRQNSESEQTTVLERQRADSPQKKENFVVFIKETNDVDKTSTSS